MSPHSVFVAQLDTQFQSCLAGGHVLCADRDRQRQTEMYALPVLMNFPLHHNYKQQLGELSSQFSLMWKNMLPHFGFCERFLFCVAAIKSVNDNVASAAVVATAGVATSTVAATAAVAVDVVTQCSVR